MSVRCCKCGYTMKTNQEIQSGIGKFFCDTLNFMKVLPTMGALAGFLNTGSNAVKCPKCSAIESWEDV